MVLVVVPGKRHQQAGVGNGPHSRENPLRLETSGGPPLIIPTYFRHASFPLAGWSLESPFSTHCRTTRPTGNPVRRALARRRSSSSSGRRIVSVLLISHNCNTLYPMGLSCQPGAGCKDRAGRLIRRILDKRELPFPSKPDGAIISKPKITVADTTAASAAYFVVAIPKAVRPVITTPSSASLCRVGEVADVADSSPRRQTIGEVTRKAIQMEDNASRRNRLGNHAETITGAPCAPRAVPAAPVCSPPHAAAPQSPRLPRGPRKAW